MRTSVFILDLSSGISRVDLKGYTRLWRKITDKWYWPANEKRPFTRLEAWMDMFLNLALGIDKGHLKRGQFEASLSDLAERWKWNKMKVHRFLTKLSKNEISWVLPGSLRGSLHLPSTITIKKYNELNPLSLPAVLPEVLPGSLPSERKERERKGKERLRT